MSFELTGLMECNYDGNYLPSVKSESTYSPLMSKTLIIMVHAKTAILITTVYHKTSLNTKNRVQLQQLRKSIANEKKKCIGVIESKVAKFCCKPPPQNKMFFIF